MGAYRIRIARVGSSNLLKSTRKEPAFVYNKCRFFFTLTAPFVFDYISIHFIITLSKHYEDEYEHTGYFAAINKSTLFTFAINGKDTGSFTL